MATVNKNFKIKSGLVVEGTTGTINNHNILTEVDGDEYIVNLIGGTTLVTSVDSGQLQVVDGQLSVKPEVFDDFGAANTAYTDAVADASNDATQKANAAEENAAGYTDGAISTEVTNRNSAISSAISTEVTNRNSAISTAKGEAGVIAQGYADTAESNANSYTDSAISTEVSDRNSAIDTAITNLNLSGTYDALGAADAALVDAKAYTDQEVAALVDGAPALLNTLNELAAAIADNPNYATDVANLVAGKADTTYVDSEISGVDSAAQGYATTAENNAKGYADSLASNYDAAGSAAAAQGNAEDYADSVATTAENNAKSYADGLATNYDASGAAATAQQNAENYADSLAVNYDAAGSATTAQMNAEDYTDTAISNLNLSGTYDALGAASTAESNANGYTDTAVANLTDGSTAFTAVNINSVASQVAATNSVASASTVTALSWNKGDFVSAKLLVKAVSGTDSHLTEVLVSLDSSDNVAISEYGTIYTSGELITVTADVSGSDARIRVTTLASSIDVTVVGTLIV